MAHFNASYIKTIKELIKMTAIKKRIQVLRIHMMKTTTLKHNYMSAMYNVHAYTYICYF